MPWLCGLREIASLVPASAGTQPPRCGPRAGGSCCQQTMLKCLSPHLQPPLPCCSTMSPAVHDPQVLEGLSSLFQLLHVDTRKGELLDHLQVRCAVAGVGEQA